MRDGVGIAQVQKIRLIVVVDSAHGGASRDHHPRVPDVVIENVADHAKTLLGGHRLIDAVEGPIRDDQSLAHKDRNHPRDEEHHDQFDERESMYLRRHDADPLVIEPDRGDRVFTPRSCGVVPINPPRASESK